jgi:hypothetical protein
MERVKQPRIVLCPSHEQMARWQAWANTLHKPKLSQFIPFIMDLAIRYIRQWSQQKNTSIDELALKLEQQKRLREIVLQARDALDKLAEALR